MKMVGLAVVVWIALAAAPALAQHPFRAQIDAAAVRFDLPPSLIERVIAAESGADARAVSPAGAMGLMQLMPETWTELRARLALGDDPFDPADNILAGAAYLKALRDRYGEPGFLAAYNAGPGRYEDSLAGRPLPLETRRYVQRLAGWAGAASAVASDWRVAGLFAPAWSSRLGLAGTGVPTASSPILFAPRREPGR